MDLEKNIWFIDDDESFRYIIKRELEKTDYADKFRVFDDGDVALLSIIERAKSGARLPDLIFLDLNMKYLEGWQMIDLLNEFEREVQVVILTSSLNPKDKERADKEPLVKKLIAKPIQTVVLVDCIKEYLT